jgi:hypothetical protein
VVTDHDEADVVSLLERDVEATLGTGHRDIIQTEAKRIREFVSDRDYYVEKVVGNVQQYFHDCRVDITWPACPNHPNHPMWFENGLWRADGGPVAELGKLGDYLRCARTCLP